MEWWKNGGDGKFLNNSSLFSRVTFQNPQVMEEWKDGMVEGIITVNSVVSVYELDI